MNNSSVINKWIDFATTVSIESLGNTLIIAPHPDDESLGCGGTISLLCKAGYNVFVIFISDGSMSHPNSQKFPALKLTTTREEEAIKALRILGVKENNYLFLRLKDTQVPSDAKEIGFNYAVENILKILHQENPQTIFVPWKNDPHVDHRASWKIMHEALQHYSGSTTVFQYFIWLWELGDKNDYPIIDKIASIKVNIATEIENKKNAVGAHVSQTTKLIDDDEHGFMLSEEILQHFFTDYEFFVKDL